MTHLRHLTLLIVLLAMANIARGQQDSTAMHISVDDVVITARQQILSLPDAKGNISINMDALSGVPRLGGAVDVLKLLQYTPGVAATQEGNTSLYVRGGDAGQSIVLLNGAPLYSPSHLLGFFSVLNTAHLSGLTLYKSGIPARYGSLTASITELRTHNHIPERVGIECNIGIIEADAAIKVPIGQRFALFASARHSYSSWLMNALINQATMSYDFGDYGLGFVADLGRMGRLTFNSHLNSDIAEAEIFNYNAQCDLRWWNALGTLRLDTQLSENAELHNTLYASVYDNRLEPHIASNIFTVKAGITDLGLKSYADINLERVRLEVGADCAFRHITPQAIALAKDDRQSRPREESVEVALYASAHWPLSRYFAIDGGMRISLFAHDKVWCYPEPRISLEFPITGRTKLWASYDMLAQYLHLVPQSNMSFATDYYMTSSRHTPPQLSHNFAIGYSSEALAGRIRWSIEAYYKYMFNVVEYDSRILDVLYGTADHKTMIHSGEGESYGIECSIGYSDSKIDAQLNYTLSKSLRLFEEINNGKPFPAHSHRGHNLTTLIAYKPSPRWTLSATFAYASGVPYTATKSIYISGNAFLREYGSYNGSKLPALHHLDLSVTYWFKCRRLSKNGINLSVYNVYARRNPLMISWDAQFRDGTIHINERRHIIYTILPSISWNIKF